MGETPPIPSSGGGGGGGGGPCEDTVRVRHGEGVADQQLLRLVVKGPTGSSVNWMVVCSSWGQGGSSISIRTTRFFSIGTYSILNFQFLFLYFPNYNCFY